MPRAEIKFPIDGEIFHTGQEVFFKGFATDIDINDVLFTQWYVEGGKHLANDTESFVTTFDREGKYNVVFKVNDFFRKESVVNVTISVVEDTNPPTISGLTLSKINILPRQKISVFAEIEDDFELDYFSLTAELGGGGGVLRYDNQSKMFVGEFLGPVDIGTYNVTVYARDASGNLGFSEAVTFSVVEKIDDEISDDSTGNAIAALTATCCFSGAMAFVAPILLLFILIFAVVVVIKKVRREKVE